MDNDGPDLRDLREWVMGTLSQEWVDQIAERAKGTHVGDAAEKEQGNRER